MQNGESNAWVSEMDMAFGEVDNMMKQLTSAIKSPEKSTLQSRAEGDIINQETDGGDNDVKVNAQEWGQGGNSKESTESLQGNLGGNNDQSGTTWRKQRSDPRIRDRKNRRNLTQGEKETLKTTAIKNEDGSPKEVCHFTDNMDFDTFAKGDIGFHFGNEQQAVERGKILNKQGRIIRAYLDIKNPIRISTDIMSWRPRNIALKLVSDDVISVEQHERILKLDNGAVTYDSPAAVELRRILSEKGYDGIVYPNMFEADGDSYIAFYPEQVIIIDDGKNTQATSDNGAASFLPESDSENGNLQSGAKKKITAEEQGKARERILKTAQKLGKDTKVIYVPRNSEELNGKKGKYVSDTKTIYLAEDLSTREAYVEVFKHEFVHRLELRRVYESFKKYLFNKSEAFGDYAISRLALLDEQLGREKIQRTAEQAKEELVQMYLDNFKKDNSIPQDIRDNFTREKAEKEAVADFVARVLFKGNNAELRVALKERDINRFTGMETDIDLFEEILQKDRNLFQRIVDAIRDFINSIKFMPNFKDLEQDIKYLEERLARVYKSGDKKKTAKNSGEVYKDENGFGDELEKSYKEPISTKDAENLKIIKRKSINQFDKNDLLRTKKWAYKYFEQLGDKSPFFRAWFGDWRAYDDGMVKLIKTKGELRKPSVKNEDTEWEIVVSRQVSKETNHHSGDNEINAIKYLPYIIDITQNAVLLNSEISDKDNPLSVMFHSMYAYTEIFGYPALLKLQVEELINEKDGSAIFRDYILQNIEEEPISIGKRFSKAHHHETDSSVISISDLFALVKKYDKTFNPNLVNPMFLNEDGTPKKFYHGSKKGGGFTVFKNWQYFTENKSYAERYTERDNENSLYEVYIKMDKPFDTRDPECKKIFEQMRMEYGLSKLQENGLPDWTDGYDIADFIEENDLDYDGIILNEGGDIVDGKTVSRGLSYVVRNSEQIKSATDNIGTFDKYDSDITYSSDDLDTVTDKPKTELTEDKPHEIVQEDIKVQHDALLEKYENGFISRDEYFAEMDGLYGKAVEQYGEFEKGEYNETDIPVPKAIAKDKPTERFARTFVGAAKLTPEMVEQFEEDVSTTPHRQRRRGK